MPGRFAISNLRTRRQRGSAMLEGAIISLGFMAIILGVMDFGRMVWSYTLISEAAREATRYAIVHGSASGHQASTDTIKGVVTSTAIGLSSSSITTNVTFSPDQSAGSTAKVEVNYSFTPVAPYIPSGTITLRSTSQMVIYQ